VLGDLAWWQPNTLVARHRSLAHAMKQLLDSLNRFTKASNHLWHSEQGKEEENTRRSAPFVLPELTMSAWKDAQSCSGAGAQVTLTLETVGMVISLDYSD